MKKLLYLVFSIIFLCISVSISLAQLTPPSSGITPIAPTHPAATQMHHNDDIQDSYGNTAATPDVSCEYDTAQTPDAMVCGVSTDSRVWIYAEQADRNTNWGKALQTNPNVCVQSADATTTTDRVCFFHDQTDGNLVTDGGDLIINPTGSDVVLPDADGLNFGTGLDAECVYNVIQTPDTFACGVSADSRLMLIYELADVATDFAKALQTNPTLCIQSADAATTTDRICLSHNQTDAVLNSDGGNIIADPAGTQFQVGVDAAGPALVDTAAAFNVATVLPDRARTTYGLGINQAGPTLSIVAAGSNQMELDSGGAIITGTTLNVRGAATLSDGSGDVDINDNVAVTGIIYQDSTPTIILGAGATTFVATRNVNIINCDAGGNTIATITGDQPGMRFCMEFINASCTITDTADGAADTVNLSAAFTSANNVILCLTHNGTAWLEISRSTNG